MFKTFPVRISVGTPATMTSFPYFPDGCLPADTSFRSRAWYKLPVVLCERIGPPMATVLVVTACGREHNGHCCSVEVQGPFVSA